MRKAKRNGHPGGSRCGPLAVAAADAIGKLVARHHSRDSGPFYRPYGHPFADLAFASRDSADARNRNGRTSSHLYSWAFALNCCFLRFEAGHRGLANPPESSPERDRPRNDTRARAPERAEHTGRFADSTGCDPTYGRRAPAAKL